MKFLLLLLITMVILALCLLGLGIGLWANRRKPPSTCSCGKKHEH